MQARKQPLLQKNQSQVNLRPEPPSTPPLTRRQVLVQAVGLLGTLALTDPLSPLQSAAVTEHQVPLLGLREPVRIVQLTDLHRSWCVSEAFLAHIVAQTNALKPDIVALTGDFVTRSSYYAESCAKALAGLRAPLGLYAVPGNHDHGCDQFAGCPRVMGALAEARVEFLTNRNTRFESGLCLAGVDDLYTGTPNLQLAFAGIKPGEPTVTLTHNPNMFSYLGLYEGVVLSGHTHGGQINIPYLTRNYLGENMRYLRGWYTGTGPRNRLYVSRGLGVVGIPVRIRSRSEIAVFDFIPA